MLQGLADRYTLLPRAAVVATMDAAGSGDVSDPQPVMQRIRGVAGSG